jgi:hypothetical protein
VSFSRFATYALTSGGIFKSTDISSSWMVLGNIAGVNVIALDPASPSGISAGTGHGVVTSTDGAATGAQPTFRPYALATDYVDGCCFQSLFKSADSGARWSPITTIAGPGSRCECQGAWAI